MNSNDNDNDTYGFISNLSPISSPRDDHLPVSSFPGETNFSQDDAINHDPSSLMHSSGEISVASTAIYMVSLSDDGEKDNAALHDDVFHTPPEQSSLPTSSDGVEHCKVNQTADADFVETGSADLGVESDLGFQEVEFTEFPAIERESLSQKDYSGIKSQHEVEEMAICQREMVSDSKNPCDFGYVNQPEQNILVSEQISAGVGGNACRGKLMSMEKNVGSQTQPEIATNSGKFGVDAEESVQNGLSIDGMCEARKLPCSDEGNNRQTEHVLATERQNRTNEQPGLRKLPVSIHDGEKNAGNKQESNSGEGQKEQKDEAVVDDVELVEIGEIREGIAENFAGSSEKVTEAFGNQKRTDKQLGCWENAESRKESEKSNRVQDLKTKEGTQQGHKTSLITALKVINELETAEGAQPHDNLNGLSLLDAAVSRGWKLPRPRWWSEKRGIGNRK